MNLFLNINFEVFLILFAYINHLQYNQFLIKVY